MQKRLLQMEERNWIRIRSPERMHARSSLQMKKKNMQQARLQNLRKFSLLQ